MNKRKTADVTDAQAQALIRKLRKMPAQLDRDFVLQAEETLQGPSDGAYRRVCLMMLTHPAAKTLDDVKNSREYAVELAGVFSAIPGAQERLRALAGLMDTASAWIMCALAQRPDMDEIMAEAKKDATLQAVQS